MSTLLEDAALGRCRTPGCQRQIGGVAQRFTDGGRIVKMVGVFALLFFKEHLKRTGDGANKSSDQRGGADFVEIVERLGQVVSHFALHVELPAERTPPYDGAGLNQPQPERAPTTGEIVTVRADRIECPQQYVGRPVPRSPLLDGRDHSWHTAIGLREQNLFFAGEVAEEGSGADVGGGSDARDGGLLVAVAFEELGRGVDDGLARAGSFAVAECHSISLSHQRQLSTCCKSALSAGSLDCMVNVLIVGAGIAGNTLAYWLARHGMRATVVERSRGLRSSGSPVDVRHGAMPIAERMGIVPRLRDAATRATALRLVDDSGRTVTRVRLGNAGGTGAEIEVPRAELATIIHDAVGDDAEFIFDDTITELRQDDHGVDVTFDRAAPRRFDLVIGADGLHSAVRRLVFGPEREFSRHLGLYVATVPLGRPADERTEVVLYNRPGRSVALHPVRDNGAAAFVFRAPELPKLDLRDVGEQRRIVSYAYSSLGWRVPQLLELVNGSDDLYFDSVSKVTMPTWSRGRIALLGDAASCVSLLGDGSSHAITGAHTLANALATEPTYTRALQRYADEHRAQAKQSASTLRLSAAILVPKSRVGIATRNLVGRLLP